MPNKTLRQRVRDAGLVPGVMVFEFFAPGMAALARHAGAQFILYDMEHSGLSIETLKGLVATCRGLGIAPMARVPRGEYHLLAPALDVGCHGVMVPMVESAEQARSIVEATRYPPTGRRGAAFGFAHDDYESGNIEEKIKLLDARNVVIAQIETERGLENVEEIAAVKEVDVLWLGHFDLTNFLGIPAQFDNPIYLKAVDRIVAAARKYRKGLGFMATDPDSSKRYHKLGFNMIAGGTDQSLLVSGWRSILSPLSR